MSPVARLRRRVLAFRGGAEAQAARAAGKPSLTARKSRGGSMECVTCVTPQRWCISVDGNTVAFGTATLSRSLPVLSSRETCVSALVLSGWSAGHSFLLDPAAALPSDLLARVFASLSLRERLHCAAVCRAWRRVIAPAPPAVLDARVWERVELTVFEHNCSDKLVNYVLPRWGGHIRELSLRGTLVGDDALRTAVTGCQHLRYLDVRECIRVFWLSCENPNRNPFSELMLLLYERALAYEHFTLLLSGSGFAAGCQDCVENCGEYLQLVTNSLALVSSWPVKSSTQDAAVAPTTAWLQCDLAAVCTNWGKEFSDNCDLFIEKPLRSNGIPAASGVVEDCCDFCGEFTCKVRASCVGLTMLALTSSGAHAGMLVLLPFTSVFLSHLR